MNKKKFNSDEMKLQPVSNEEVQQIINENPSGAAYGCGSGSGSGSGCGDGSYDIDVPPGKVSGKDTSPGKIVSQGGNVLFNEKVYISATVSFSLEISGRSLTPRMSVGLSVL